MAFLTEAANRGSISTGYDIDNSVKLDGNNNERIARASNTIGTPTNAKIATLSFWAKRSALKSDNAHFSFIANAGAASTYICFEQDKARVYTTGGNSLSSNALFRDTSAWYHFVAAFDMTQGTASNRVKIYINGVQITSFSTETYGTQNNDIGLYDTNMTHYFGYAGSQGWFGYIAEAHLIDGQQLAPTEFGEFDSSGIWKPKEYDGTYGDEGYYLDFEDSSNLGLDVSGNSNNFGALYAITAVDQATDTPTNNFCTFNAVNMSGSSATLAEGATFTASTANGAFTTYGTMAPSSGKWWWEGKIQVFESGSTYACIGATTNLAGLPSVSAQISGGHVIKLAKAQKWVLNDTGYSYGAAYADADIINVGLDLDNRKFYTYKNGTIDDANGIDISSTTFDGFGSQWMPLVITYGSGGSSSYEINFGGYRTYGIGSPESDENGYGTFEYAPPSGYYALCTKNLEEYG